MVWIPKRIPAAQTLLKGKKRKAYHEVSPIVQEKLVEQRFEKMDSRHQKTMKQREESKIDYKRYQEKAQLFNKTFSKLENINNLFPEKEYKRFVSSRKELIQELNGGTIQNEQHLLYYSPIRHSIMCLIVHFLNTILVEINLRKDLIPDDPVNNFSPGIFRDDILNQIKDKSKKREIIQIMDAFHDSSSTAMKDLFNHQTKISDHFNSLEFWRYNFMNYKSGQYLNYDHSDTMANIQGLQFIRYESTEVNDDEILAKFAKSFQEFDLKRQDDSLLHLNLIVEIISTLFTCTKTIPSVLIFKYLLDKFGQMELYNYQSIVYDNLPSYETCLTSLADPIESNRHAPRLCHQLIDVIESKPEILESLIEYQTVRGDVKTFMELLRFYRLREAAAYEKALLRTTLSALVSKSRFLSNRSASMENEDFIFNNQRRPLLVPISTIYQTINACIELKQFEYIDLLFSKLVLFNVRYRDQDERFVALTVGAPETDEDYSFLISENLTPSEVAKEVINRDLLLLLLRACREGKDLGRLLWMMPYLDQYIEGNMMEAKPHIEVIKKYYNESLIHGIYNLVSIFEDSDSQQPINSEFINSLYETLEMFGIDGKIYKYDSYFEFKKTIPKKVKRNEA